MKEINPAIAGATTKETVRDLRKMFDPYLQEVMRDWIHERGLMHREMVHTIKMLIHNILRHFIQFDARCTVKVFNIFSDGYIDEYIASKYFRCTNQNGMAMYLIHGNYSADPSEWYESHADDKLKCKWLQDSTSKISLDLFYIDHLDPQKLI